MEQLKSFSAKQIRDVILKYDESLKSYSENLNSLNVYPVPDGDTGTNMSFTLKSVIEELAESDDNPEAQWEAIRHGSLMGARGNSGVILSQILRGLADSFSSKTQMDNKAIAEALTHASEAAYASVMKPVEGTILTVSREIAEKAQELVKSKMALTTFLSQLVSAGEDSLNRTPDLLPVLKNANVVDAGGAGYLLLIQCFLHIADGTAIKPPPKALVNASNLTSSSETNDGEKPDVSELRYEVMFFLDAPESKIDQFKLDWQAVGDSIVVVGGDGLYNCHIHSNDIGESIEAGIRAGRPYQIRVTDLQEELFHIEDHIEVVGASEIIVPNPSAENTAVIAVVAGKGIQQIFASMGVNAIVAGGQSMNPSVKDLLEAVQQVQANEVIILPNNKNIIPVSEQVDHQVSKNVIVVPTRSIPEGFSALLAFDPAADAKTNSQSMSSMAESVATGEVTQAVRDSETDAGKVTEGDWIGLDRTGVIVARQNLGDAALDLLQTLIGDEHEIVTIIEGQDCPQEVTKDLLAWLSNDKPEIEVEVHSGGQPLYPYYFGIE
ncbi:MAG: DAK2 domain-containing protein [Actinomycetota bacterium]|nr:DAK2 domain-containing protein [Actinomycetota bacterium]